MQSGESMGWGMGFGWFGMAIIAVLVVLGILALAKNIR